jgi:hypothetical protein
MGKVLDLATWLRGRPAETASCPQITLDLLAFASGGGHECEGRVTVYVDQSGDWEAHATRASDGESVVIGGDATSPVFVGRIGAWLLSRDRSLPDTGTGLALLASALLL